MQTDQADSKSRCAQSENEPEPSLQEVCGDGAAGHTRRHEAQIQHVPLQAAFRAPKRRHHVGRAGPWQMDRRQDGNQGPIRRRATLAGLT